MNRSSRNNNMGGVSNRSPMNRNSSARSGATTPVRRTTKHTETTSGSTRLTNPSPRHGNTPSKEEVRAAMALVTKERSTKSTTTANKTFNFSSSDTQRQTPTPPSPHVTVLSQSVHKPLIEQPTLNSYTSSGSSTGLLDDSEIPAIFRGVATTTSNNNANKPNTKNNTAKSKTNNTIVVDPPKSPSQQFVRSLFSSRAVDSASHPGTTTNTAVLTTQIAKSKANNNNINNSSIAVDNKSPPASPSQQFVRSLFSSKAMDSASHPGIAATDSKHDIEVSKVTNVVKPRPLPGGKNLFAKTNVPTQKPKINYDDEISSSDDSSIDPNIKASVNRALGNALGKMSINADTATKTIPVKSGGNMATRSQNPKVAAFLKDNNDDDDDDDTSSSDDDFDVTRNNTKKVVNNLRPMQTQPSVSIKPITTPNNQNPKIAAFMKNNDDDDDDDTSSDDEDTNNIKNSYADMNPNHLAQIANVMNQQALKQTQVTSSTATNKKQPLAPKHGSKQQFNVAIASSSSSSGDFSSGVVNDNLGRSMVEKAKIQAYIDSVQKRNPTNTTTTTSSSKKNIEIMSSSSSSDDDSSNLPHNTEKQVLDMINKINKEGQSKMSYKQRKGALCDDIEYERDGGIDEPEGSSMADLSNLNLYISKAAELSQRTDVTNNEVRDIVARAKRHGLTEDVINDIFAGLIENVYIEDLERDVDRVFEEADKSIQVPIDDKNSKKDLIKSWINAATLMLDNPKTTMHQIMTFVKRAMRAEIPTDPILDYLFKECQERSKSRKLETLFHNPSKSTFVKTKERQSDFSSKFSDVNNKQVLSQDTHSYDDSRKDDSPDKSIRSPSRKSLDEKDLSYDSPPKKRDDSPPKSRHHGFEEEDEPFDSPPKKRGDHEEKEEPFDSSTPKSPHHGFEEEDEPFDSSPRKPQNDHAKVQAKTSGSIPEKHRNDSDEDELMKSDPTKDQDYESEDELMASSKSKSRDLDYAEASDMKENRPNMLNSIDTEEEALTKKSLSPDTLDYQSVLYLLTYIKDALHLFDTKSISMNNINDIMKKATDKGLETYLLHDFIEELIIKAEKIAKNVISGEQKMKMTILLNRTRVLAQTDKAWEQELKFLLIDAKTQGLPFLHVKKTFLTEKKRIILKDSNIETATSDDEDDNIDKLDLNEKESEEIEAFLTRFHDLHVGGHLPLGNIDGIKGFVKENDSEDIEVDLRVGFVKKGNQQLPEIPFSPSSDDRDDRYAINDNFKPSENVLSLSKNELVESKSEYRSGSLTDHNDTNSGESKEYLIDETFEGSVIKDMKKDTKARSARTKKNKSSQSMSKSLSIQSTISSGIASLDEYYRKKEEKNILVQLKETMEKTPSQDGHTPPPINGVEAAQDLFMKRWTKRDYRISVKPKWKPSLNSRIRKHPGYIAIDKVSLKNASMVVTKPHALDGTPWEYRDVKQYFLEKTNIVTQCNWFGSIDKMKITKRCREPICRPISVIYTERNAPEPDDWHESWFTTWYTRKHNPNKLAKDEKGDLYEDDDQGTVVTKGTMFSRHSLKSSYKSVKSSKSSKSRVSVRSSKSSKSYMTEGSIYATLPEIGTVCTIRFKVGEHVSRVHSDYTSYLKRSRWRKKYFPNGIFS